MNRADTLTENFLYVRIGLSLLLLILLVFAVSCQQTANNTNTISNNTNANLSNSNANLSNGSANANSTANANLLPANSDEAREPEQYQAKLNIRFEAVGNQQKTAFPNISANIARSGQDRRMEFSLPNDEPAVYLDKTESDYLILPNRQQYAVLNKDSLGFDLQQMMMPAEIINRVKTARGVERVGEEDFNGKNVVRYRYAAAANTQTQAGQVNTDSFFLIDRETGLPIYSETVTQSQSGNVQGYNSLRIITEITDVSTNANAELFALPTDYKQIDSQQVRAQVNLVFNTVAVLLGQLMKSVQTNPNTNTNSATPATSPTSR